MAVLPLSFFQRPATAAIARDLLGKILVTRLQGEITAGRIVETEAYCGTADKACHAWGGRKTPRTATMYEPGGIAYIYLCYGIHHLFNVVTHRAGEPHAVLIRAVEPLEGTDLMMERRNKLKLDYSLTRGPGAMSQALGIKTAHNGISLRGELFSLEEGNEKIKKGEIESSPRIGVDYAGEDALLPLRFSLRNNKWVSKSK